MLIKAEEQMNSRIVASHLVTEVLDWGETITAIRLEYVDEIWCGSIFNCLEDQTYALQSSHFYIDKLYVNRSGRKGDVQLCGKYVFLELGLVNPDPINYRDHVLFQESGSTPLNVDGNLILSDDFLGGMVRHRANFICVQQNVDIPMKNGETAYRTKVLVHDEIRLIIDDFETHRISNAASEEWLNYHLFVPDGAEQSDTPLPLVVHFPSGDYNYRDYSNKLQGALFAHPDCTVWASNENQREHPSYVMTVGGRFSYMDWGTEKYAHECWPVELYVKAIKEVIAQHNVDEHRIYAVSLGGGGGALWKIGAAYPDLFAAQLCTSYDFYSCFLSVERGREIMIKNLESMRCWWFCGQLDYTGLHSLSKDDERLKGEFWEDLAGYAGAQGYKIDMTGPNELWNGFLRGEAAADMAQAQIDRADQDEANALISVFIPGTIQASCHWSWTSTYSNTAVRKWLYQQRKNVQRRGYNGA